MINIGIGIGLSIGRNSGIMLGSELVIDGDFGTPASWTVTSGVTISGGTCNLVSKAGTGAYQSIGLQTNKKYLVGFDVVSISGGLVSAWAGGAQSSTSNPGFSSTGAKSFIMDLTGLTPNGLIVIGGYTTATCSIDNFSVREIL